MKKIKNFFKTAFPDKRSKIIGTIFLIIIIFLGVFFIIGKVRNEKVSANKLMEKYISGINADSRNSSIGTTSAEIASIQKMDAKISTSDGNIKFNLENRRDTDTDHLMINYVSQNETTTEMYVDKIDQQVGIYLKKDETNWGFELKPKQSAVDDPRTEYIEVSLDSAINLSVFEELSMSEKSDIENTYLVTSKVNGYIMLQMLGNNYQALYIKYDALASYFSKYNRNIILNCSMYFDIDTKKLIQIHFTSAEDAFEVSNNASPDIMVNSIDIKLTNESYDDSNVYVPEEVEKHTFVIP